MLRKLRARLTYANVMSTIAVFLAIGGGLAWALANNSVRSRHIVNGQVKKQDVQDLRYTNLNLKNGWSSFGGSLTPAAALDAQGVVHLRGAIAQGIADGDNFAQLPTAFRPNQDVFMPVATGNHNLGRLNVEPNGEMTVEPDAGGTVPADAHKNFTSLDGVTYEGH